MVRDQLDSRGSLADGDSIGTDHTPEEIVDALGLDHSEIQWRKDFVGFSSDDARRLENLAPVVEANEAEFVNGFLQPLFQTEKTKHIADRSPRDNAALQAIVSSYYKTLTGGEYGPEYFKHRTRIGMLHDKLDMPLHYFAGMFSNLTTRAVDILIEDLQSTYQTELDPEDGQMASRQAEQTAAALKSIVRMLNLDMQVVNDTYLYSFTESLRGEIKATQQMRETVSASIDTARESSTQVRGNAAEMQSIIQKFKNTSSSVSTEVSDLSATIEEIAASSSTASNTSREALEEVKTGKQRAAESVEAMEDIAATQAELGERVDELVSAIDEVNEIVDVINNIADQTNILALNASIEAARAGDAGSGFNVVANEVKSLAEQTQQEASEIESLLEGVTSDIGEVEDQINRVEASVETGQTNIVETDDALDTINQKVTDATSSMDEVATATDNQAASTEKVSSILDELNEQARDMVTEIESLETATKEQSDQITAIAQATENLNDQEALKLTDVTSEGEWTGNLHPTETTLAQSNSKDKRATDGGSVSRDEMDTASEVTPPNKIDPDIYEKLPDGMPDSVISQIDNETLKSIAEGDIEDSPFGGED